MALVWTTWIVALVAVLEPIGAPVPGAAPLAEPVPAPAATDPQDEARRLFRRGNEYFEQDRYAEALGAYRSARELWDHPAIDFNIAVCLINLDQPVEAVLRLERSITGGQEALGVDFYAQAMTYLKLLRARLARVEVRCEQPGVSVTLDGKPLLACPQSTERYLLPGEHQLFGHKEGLLPHALALDLRAGRTYRTTIELSPPRESKELVRRWKPWIPWIPVAVGITTGLVGVGVRAAAVANAKQYDREVARLCPQGCSQAQLPETVRTLPQRVHAQSGAAIGLLVAGGTAVVAGAILLVLNRRRPVAMSRLARPWKPALWPLGVTGRF